MIPIYSVAHMPPILPARMYDAIVDTKPREDYETLTAIAAYPALARLATTRQVGICGWRKIVVRVPPTGKIVDLADPSLLNVEGRISVWQPKEWGQQHLTREMALPYPGHDFLLIHHPHGGKSILQFFTECHGLRDWPDYMGLAREMNLITWAQQTELENMKTFIEGGCVLGIYPGDFARETLTGIAALGSEYSRRHGARVRSYDPVQRRIISNMSER